MVDLNDEHDDELGGVDVSDEDIGFFEDHLAYSEFLVNLESQPANLSNGLATKQQQQRQQQNKKKRLNENAVAVDPEEYYYAQASRGDERNGGLDGSHEQEAGEHLPVKTLEGKLVFPSKGLPVTETNDSPAPVDSDSDAHESPPPQDIKPPRHQKELMKFESVEEGKHHIAILSTQVMADPQLHVLNLQKLQSICDSWSQAADSPIPKLAMVSLASVYSDILPGYRIRLPTQAEAAMAVSKEVKQLREYEASLLKCYETYVHFLVRNVRAAPLRQMAVRCISSLLSAAPHFNCASNLLTALVPRMDAAAEDISTLCCASIERIFTEDGRHGGEMTTLAAELIADFVRQRRCFLRPQVIKVFEKIRFDAGLAQSTGSSDRSKGGRKGSHSSSADGAKSTEGSDTLLSKRQRKAQKRKMSAKLHKDVAADFRESQAVVDASERKAQQTATLSAVFETYFRVLKTSLQPPTHSRPPCGDGSAAWKYGRHPLLLPALEGLSKFSHLISADFMSDLLQALEALARGPSQAQAQGEGEGEGSEEDEESVGHRLACCSAAFTIVKANLNALTVDLQAFYAHFFSLISLLPFIQLSIMQDSIRSVWSQCLELMLWEGRHLDVQRCAAFIHRLLQSALHLEPAMAASAVLVAGRLLQRHARCRDMLINDEMDGGPASTFFDSAFECGTSQAALGSVLWELCILSRHGYPPLATMASHVAQLALDPAKLDTTCVTPRAALEAHSAALTFDGCKATTKGHARSENGHRSQAKLALDLEEVSELQDLNLDVEGIGGRVDELFAAHFDKLKDKKRLRRLIGQYKKSQVVSNLLARFRRGRKKKISVSG